MDLEAFSWLLTDDGQRLLEQASLAYADADGDPVRAATTVRRSVDAAGHSAGGEFAAARAAAALTQVQLRVKAVPKFGEQALTMYFTPDGLEQATRPRVAAHRAARLVAADVGSLIDLGCGIGGDLLACAQAGLTTAGVDLDPMRVAVATANLAALGLPGAVQLADATTIDPSGFGAAFLDPARRTARGRVFDPAGWTPPWEFVTQLLTRRAVVKVAPGIPHDLVPEHVEAEWVSDHGDLKEASLWSPLFATTRRRATVIGPGGLASMTEEDDPFSGQPRPVHPLGAFLYEPDDAVIRAGLVTGVAAGVNGGLVDEHIAWVTSDDAFRTPFARSWRVVEQLPFREKQLKLALRQRNIGTLTIKPRGVDVVPEQLRKRLALKGDEAATLVLTRVAGAGTALLVTAF